MKNLFRLLAEVSDLLHNVSIDTAFMVIPATASSVAGGELRYPPRVRVEESIRLHRTSTDSRRFAIIPTRKMFVMCVSFDEREMGDGFGRFV